MRGSARVLRFETLVCVAAVTETEGDGGAGAQIGGLAHLGCALFGGVAARDQIKERGPRLTQIAGPSPALAPATS
jgi:hypothetical protein